MTNFDAETMRELRDVREVAIRTEKHPKSAVVFVRSWRGAEGRWYRDLAAGGPATLEYASRRLAVQASPADDEAAVARVSREFLRKYRRNSHAQEMVRSETLPTTLRLEPR